MEHLVYRDNFIALLVIVYPILSYCIVYRVIQDLWPFRFKINLEHYTVLFTNLGYSLLHNLYIIVNTDTRSFCSQFCMASVPKSMTMKCVQLDIVFYN